MYILLGTYLDDKKILLLFTITLLDDKFLVFLSTFLDIHEFTAVMYYFITTCTITERGTKSALTQDSPSLGSSVPYLCWIIVLFCTLRVILYMTIIITSLLLFHTVLKIT